MAKELSFRVKELAGVQPDDLGTLRMKIFGAPGTDSKHVRITEAERDLILDILQDSDTEHCPRHGGEWGGDETCEECTDDDGNPRPKR